VLLDNAERLDKLVNGPAADVPDRGGDPLYSWRQMMAKNDEVRQNLIPLSRQYMTLADAQAILQIFLKEARRITAALMIARWLLRLLTTVKRLSLPGGKCHLRNLLMAGCIYLKGVN
jgi:hypothetical protein